MRARLGVRRPVRNSPAEPANGKLHILFVHAADELYGADRVLLELVRGLDRHRFRATVVLPNDVPYDGALTRELVAIGVAVRHMRLAVLRRKYFSAPGAARLVAWSVGSGSRLARLIVSERVDIVHSHTAAVVSGAIAAAITRRPHLWHVSEIVTQPTIVRRVIAWLIPRAADSIVTVSAAVRDHLVASEPLAAGKTTVIYNGIDPRPFSTSVDGDRVRAELGLGTGDRIVLMIGRVGSWKGQELLLDAAPAVVRRLPNVRFVLVGGVFDRRADQLDRLRETAERLGIADRVTISDFRTDVAALLSVAAVFVQPSILPDPFPTTILEAMAAGKPVVATDHGGLPEMVVHGVTGYLVPPTDPAELGARIAELLGNRELALTMGSAGRDRVEEYFSLAGFNAAYAAAYETLAARRHASHTR